jgi:hypothetical protein
LDITSSISPVTVPNFSPIWSAYFLSREAILYTGTPKNFFLYLIVVSVIFFGWWAQTSLFICLTKKKYHANNEGNSLAKKYPYSRTRVIWKQICFGVRKPHLKSGISYVNRNKHTWHIKADYLCFACFWVSFLKHVSSIISSGCS